MPETRFTRALLSALIFGAGSVVIAVLLRVATWLLGDDARMWSVVALVAFSGFVLQWFTDRSQ